MISTVHYKLHALGNRAEFANDKFISDEWIMVGYVLFKLIRTFGIVIVGIVPDNDIRIPYYIFNIAKGWEFLVWECFIWIWYILHSYIIKHLCR